MCPAEPLIDIRHVSKTDVSSSIPSILPKVKATMVFFLTFFVCLGFFVPLENFHSYGDVRYHYCWRVASFDLCSALMAIEQWGFFSDLTYTVTRGIRLLWLSPRTRDTHIFCRPFGSRAVTTCFSAVIRTSNLPLAGRATISFTELHSTATYIASTQSISW